MIATVFDRSKFMKREWKKRRPPTVEEYIKLKTKREGECLIWQGAGFWYKYKYGYASRCVYEALVGPIPRGKFILHSCDVQKCVELKHLRVGTKKENRRDFMERHPRVRDLTWNSKRGKAAVSKFWSGLTSKKRKEFIDMRVRNKTKKHPAGSPSRLAQAEKMRKYHAERRRARDDSHVF